MKWEHIDIDYERFLDMVHEIVLNKSWELIPTDRPYGSLNALFRAELGVTYDQAIERVRVAESRAGVRSTESLTVAMADANPVLSGEDLSKAREIGGGKGADFGKRGGRGNAKPLGELLTKGFSGRSDRNSNDHLLRRLARIDRDTGSEWIKRFQDGEFRSVRAAAKEAGIPVSPSVRLGAPQTVAQTIRRLMGQEYAEQLAASITSKEAINEEDAE